MPRPDELPELPDACVAHLTGGAMADAEPSPVAAVELVDVLTTGVPCRAVSRALSGYQRRTGDGEARHDSMRDVLLAVVRLGEQGHAGVAEAVGVLHDGFTLDVSDDRGPAEAEAEWRRAYNGAVAMVSSQPTAEADRRCCSPDRTVQSGHGTPLNLPAELWSARPALTHIRQAAHSRGRSADLVLLAALTRLSAMCSHRLRIDAGLGEASLNLFGAAIGPSGRGKSTACTLARELVDAPGYLTGGAFHDGLGVGSGEGIAEAFMGTVEEPTGEVYKSGTRRGDPKFAAVRKQVRHNVFVYVDEGQALTAMVGRSGATIGPTLRSAWGGELLGQANAREETTRHLPAGSYSLGLLIGFQETTAQPLLGDAAAGTPQRFLFCSATDPHVPSTAAEHPGPLAVGLTGEFGLSLVGVVTFAPEIRAELWQANLRRVRGEADDSDPLDSHESLLRAKVAALLALLDGRRQVDTADWGLAAMVWETSCAVRSAVVAYGRDEAGRVAEARADAYVQREARAQVARSQAGSKVERIAAQLARRIHADGAMKPGYARNLLAGRDRTLFAEALEHATVQGWLSVDSAEVSPGPSKPAET